jgi:tRNA pseudouridine55 synthase
VELFSGCKQIKIRTDKQLRTSKKFKIGHAGTLDPLATGLLLVCTGNSQRELQNFKVRPKNTGTFFIGATASYDLETEVDQTYQTAISSINSRN